MRPSVHRRIRALGLAAATAGLVFAGAAAASPASPSSTPCPTAPFTMPAAMTANGPPPKMVFASTIAPSDTSTSTVISPDAGDQITCGKAELDQFRDVVFSTPKARDGTPKPLAMDILAPKGGRRLPLVVYVTGGGFLLAQKEAALNLRTYVAEAGFVVASVQYRTLLDGGTYRDGVGDVKSAIRFLRGHADQYGIDPHHVAVWGESAGGYLASMVGVTGDDHSFETGDNPGQSDAVQAVVNKFGASDLSKIAADFDPAAQQAYAGPNPVAFYVGGFTPAGMADPRANPLTYVKRADPPFLNFSGSQDRLISPSQTLLIHTALRAAGAQSTRYVLTGAGHGDLAFMGDMKSGLVWSSRQSMDLIVAFLRQSLKP